MDHWIVMEVQKWTNGTWHSTDFHFDDKMRALSKFYAVMSEAAIAQIPINGAILMDGFLNVLKKEECQHGEWEGYVPSEEPEEEASDFGGTD